MKRIALLLSVCACVLVGCGGKKGAGAGACADAVGKGIDRMTAAGQKRMATMSDDDKAKMAEASVKIKAVVTNRCTEDKWSAEVIGCYDSAASREDLMGCRKKLPADQSAKLQAEEMQVMSQMMGGMGGGMGHGMHPPMAGSGAAMPTPAMPTPAMPTPAMPAPAPTP